MVHMLNSLNYQLGPDDPKYPDHDEYHECHLYSTCILHVCGHLTPQKLDEKKIAEFLRARPCTPMHVL